jgi:hypothetical protein
VGGAKRRPRCFACFRQGMQRFFGCTAFGGAHCFFAKKQVRNPVQYKSFVRKTKRIFVLKIYFDILTVHTIIISKSAEMVMLEQF